MIRRSVNDIVRSTTLRDTAILFVGLGVTAVIGFIYTVILARVLAPSLFGVYSSITALATIVYSLGDLGITPSLINFIPKNRHNKTKYLVNSFWMQFVVAVLILGFFGLASLVHNLVVPGSLKTDLLVAGGLSANYLLLNFAQGVFTAEKRFWSYSLSQILDASIKILIVWILFSLGGLSITSALVANFISTILALLITFGKELYQTEFEIHLPIIRQIINYAKWIAASRVFSVMLSKIDIILLNLLAGAFHAGIFSAASRVALFFALLISSLGSVINPRFSSFKTSEQVSGYIKKLLLFISVVSTVMVFLGQMASPIIQVVYGLDYMEAASVFKYLTISMVPFLYSVIIMSPLLYTYNETRFYATTMAVQVVSIVLLEIILIPRLGSMAPVIATGLANTFVLATSAKRLSTRLRSH